MKKVGQCSNCVVGGSSNTHLWAENCGGGRCHRCLNLFATVLGTANISTANAETYVYHRNKLSW